MRWPVALIWIVLPLLGACSRPEPVGDATPGIAAAPASAARPLVASLGEDVARARSRRVSDVSYRLAIDLGDASTGFSGSVDAAFRLADAREPLTVDFDRGSVTRAELNGAVVDVRYNGSFLTLPPEALRAGTNTLRIEFSHAFGRDGTGLHRFEDPEDGRIYLYTYLWPYYANQVFPLFDQPDLKAEFELSVTAPADWIVVSTTAAREQVRAGAATRWRFERTPRIASYVFSLHAGPYHVWEDRAGAVPLRLLARQSLAPHVPAQEWLSITRNGLDYYGRYFGIPYPFGKYDQLLVPDFQIGGMENVAAVTFYENAVQRQASSHEERERRAGLILHEMAHMWFGDLVTHAWWNGLWLNESFATQMAQLALIATTGFTDAWHPFFVDSKRAAYLKDSRVTTHPIEMPIRSTSEFFSVFDEITYEKGSSVLKQLAQRVGPETYRRGVGMYLAQHAYGNTELADFIAAIAAAAQTDLAGWSREWLHEPGFNVVSTRTTCEQGRLASLQLLQRAQGAGPASRSHRARIALYALDGHGRLLEPQSIDATFDGATAGIAVPAGTPCPALVFPNHDDWGYFRVQLDAAERAVVAAHLFEVKDALARSMLLQELADAAIDGDYPVAEVLALLERVIAREADFRVLSQASGLVRQVLTLLERLQPESQALLAAVRPRFEALGRQRMEAAAKADERRLWFDFGLDIAGTEATLDRLRALLDGGERIEGLPLSDDLRWRVIAVLARWGAADAEARLAAQRRADPSDAGEKMAIAIDAALPDLHRKAAWLARLRAPDAELGLARQRYAMNAIFPANQGATTAQLLPQVLDGLNALGRDVDPYFAARYGAALLAPVCTPESLALYDAALADTHALGSAALLFLREARQADAECGRLRERLVLQPGGTGMLPAGADHARDPMPAGSATQLNAPAHPPSG